MDHTSKGIATLSFASRDEHGISLWSPAIDGTAIDFNAEGRRRAQELLSLMQSEGLPFLLGHVTEAIVKQDWFGPMECSFFAVIAEAAVEGCVPAARGVSRPLLSVVR